MTSPSLRQSADREMIPRILLRAMLALVLAALGIATYARVADLPLSAMPPAAAVTHERSLILISDGVSGAVDVLSPEGVLIARLDGETGGFVAGVARVIERERAKIDGPQTAPVVVSRRSNGRLDITDPVTGWRADLMGFGATNAKSFARLLDQP